MSKCPYCKKSNAGKNINALMFHCGGKDIFKEYISKEDYNKLKENVFKCAFYEHLTEKQQQELIDCFDELERD